LITLRNFDIEKYLKEGSEVYGKRAEIEAMADEISERSYDNIVLIGIGGTWDEWYPIKHVMEHYTKTPIILENAAELCIKNNRNYITEKSCVLTMSASGDTKEILEAVKMLRSESIPIYGFTKSAETPLARLLTKAIYVSCGDCEANYLICFMLGLRLLYNAGEYPDYARFADQMKYLYEDLLLIRQQFESRAREIAEAYAKEPYSIFVGSGTLWGETVLFSMCILEEMQWVRTRAVSSADFFHGTLELVEKGVPVFLIKGEDEYRVLDERVERFASQYTDKMVVIDTKEYDLPGISEDFRVITSPMILTALLSERLAAHYELVTGHSLKFRRYYRQFEY